jgi:pimeloyl-ACP methyl ester carboxylesterase
MGWDERKIEVDGVDVSVLEAGKGPALLILHDEMGPADWQEWHEMLSGHRRLVMPVAPGFRGDRIKWMRNVTDLSRFYGRMLREMGGSPVDVVGFSFGGWIAAEMAVNNPTQLRRLALVSPFGVKPEQGVIMDMYIMTTAEYLKASVVDPEKTAEFGKLFNQATPQTIESWEDSRIESAQLGWEPYMHNPSLPHHLRGLKGLPALVVYGEQDAILPESAAKTYAQNIPGAKLVVLTGCGHRPEIEDAATFVKTLTKFID